MGFMTLSGFLIAAVLVASTPSGPHLIAQELGSGLLCSGNRLREYISSVSGIGGMPTADGEREGDDKGL